MSTPQDEPAPDQVAMPTVSTAPTSGTTAPSGSRWHWGAIPDHLGRARTSTIVLSVLFLAVFTLYLNVRPDVQPTGTTPAGGGSDIEAPVNPLVPSEPTTPEQSEEPAPTTTPDETAEPTEAPTTSRTPSSSSADPSTEPSSPTRTSGPAEPTGGTTGQDTPAPSSPSTP